MKVGLVAHVAAVVMASTALHAHHSIATMYDAGRPVTMEGVVAAYHFENPHPFVELEVMDANGRKQAWRLEFDNLRELAAVGMNANTLKPGDRLVVTGSGARNQSRSLYVRRLRRPADDLLYEQVGSSPRVRLPAR
jgi:hypothetical protein